MSISTPEFYIHKHPQILTKVSQSLTRPRHSKWPMVLDLWEHRLSTTIEGEVLFPPSQYKVLEQPYYSNDGVLHIHVDEMK